MADSERHTIGEAINLLKDDFPEVTVSKLRFLEGQGLIDPSRTASGYREFTAEDLERIRYILRQQRDHYLPLKVIKAKLTAWERGEDPVTELPEGPLPETYFASSGVSMTRDELARASGLSVEQIGALVEHGLLVPMELGGGKEAFVDGALVVARAARRLLAYGLEPRHLRSFRLAAQREVDILRGLAEPLVRHPNPENRRRAAVILAETAQAARELQETVVRTLLRDVLEG